MQNDRSARRLGSFFGRTIGLNSSAEEIANIGQKCPLIIVFIIAGLVQRLSLSATQYWKEVGSVLQ